jgi:trehalose-6-phosphate synthase
MAESFHIALQMPEAERRERMHALRAHVMAHDVSKWSDKFLAQLAVAGS